MSEILYWPNLPVKKILPVEGKFEYYLKSRNTSEQLIPAAIQKDGFLNYQFYYNKASKLIGYRFFLDTIRQGDELFPRVTSFISSVMASYVPSDKVDQTGDGDFFVVYHDLNIRLIRYNAASAGVTYCILMRSKLDNIG